MFHVSTMLPTDKDDKQQVILNRFWSFFIRQILDFTLFLIMIINGRLKFSISSFSGTKTIYFKT